MACVTTWLATGLRDSVSRWSSTAWYTMPRAASAAWLASAAACVAAAAAAKTDAPSMTFIHQPSSYDSSFSLTGWPTLSVCSDT